MKSLILGVSMGLVLGCSSEDTEPTDAGVLEVPEWSASFDAEAQDSGWLLSAWGPEAGDLYAVGGTPEEGRVMHFNGEAWSKMDLGIDVPLINWVYGFGSDDVFFVGNGGTAVHYDGARFELLETPVEKDLWGVWGAAPNDVWAVGGNPAADAAPALLHYDGVTWTETATIVLSRPGVRAFFKVWGTSSDNVYVVGQRGAIVHWDGSDWKEVESGTGEDLVSLWGTGSDRIMVVGGRNNGVAVKYDGQTWTSQSLAPLPGLNGVWARSPDKFHIGGTGGSLATLDYETLSYTEEPSNTFLSLHALFGAGDQLYAVGGTLLSLDPPFTGVALGRDLNPDE